jgi:hypothetical protein
LTRRTALQTLAAAAARLAPGAEADAKTGRWTLQYFWDRDDDTFTITDFQVTSTRFGIAVGFTESRTGKTKPMALVMRDGGKWEEARLPDAAVSVFFLNDSLGWLVTEKAIWRTEEGGRDWKRIKKARGIRRVYFKDDQTGWAVGSEKTILATQDGGLHWTKLEAADQPKTNPEYTSYNLVEFVGSTGKNGIIIGASVPPRRGESRKPAWLDPSAAASVREWPATTIALETHDGGTTWTSQTAPAFGVTSSFRTIPDGRGLVLIRFQHAFEWPSEVYLSRGKDLTRIFRERSRLVTDCVWWTPTKPLLAVIEPPGRLYQLPVPGKVHMLYSTDFKNWIEMPVDYRAFATSLKIGVADPEHLWVATDSGQILQYVP